MKEILRRAKGLVVPPLKEVERLGTVATGVLRRAEAVSRRYPDVVDAILGGSYAKQTWLPGEADIDVFVRFNVDVPEDRFEKLGLRIGAEVTRGYPRGKKYSQHPYIEADVEGVTVNVVPCYAVERGKWKSAADRSPFHVSLVRERLDEELRLDVRLLKKFMRGVGVYGAELETEGFSGYVAEVLVLKHGSFEGVLKSLASLKATNKEKLIHLADPVDENRDLARAISNENIGKFVLASRAFLSNPSLRFFTGLSGKKRPGLEQHVLGIRFTHPRLSEDILWGELKRTMRHLLRHAEKNGFKFVRTTIASDNKGRSAFLLMPLIEELSELEERVGPSVLMQGESREFATKNAPKARLIWVGEDARLHLLQRRKHRKISTFLKDLLGSEVRDLGASPDLAGSLGRAAKILEGSKLLATAKRESWLSEGLEKIVSDSVGTNPD